MVAELAEMTVVATVASMAVHWVSKSGFGLADKMVAHSADSSAAETLLQ